MLIYLLLDAARNTNDIQNRLIENPKAVAKEYRLSKSEVALLRKGDPLEILGQLTVQAAQIIGTFGKDQGPVMLPWPSGDVTVNGITPNRGKIGATINVTVTGINFQAGATLTFASPVRTIQANVSSVTSGPESSLSATIMFPGGSAGKYDVIVENPDGGIGTLAQGFAVK